MRIQGAVGLVLVVLVAGVAFADDESDRKDVIRAIDDKVDNVSSELSGFESDSDERDVDDALSNAREIKDLVSKLERVKGSDSRAGSMVAYYPRYIDDFREAARHLKKMKELQRQADGVADKCSSDENALHSTIRTYVGSPDDADEALTKLPELGKSLGRTWDEKMKKLRDTDREMQGAAGYAQFSVSTDKWSYVSSNFGNARNGMQRYWKDKLSAADTACKRLELGEKHPDIEKAIADLSKYRGSAKGTVTQLKKDYNEWLREVRKLRKFSDDDRNALRDVLCTSGEYEMEAKVKDVADRWASQISSVYGTTLGQADRLKSRAQVRELAKYKGPKEVLTGIGQNLSNLEKLKSYELQGSNNPAIRAKMEWGKKRHLDLQGSCTYAELEISSSDCDNRVRPGSGCRVDCVKTGSTCVVIEFKPDNPPAKDEGGKQLTSYVDGIDKWYKRDKAAMFGKYPSLAQCENNDKTSLNLRPELITYELCSATVKNEFGQQLEETTLDLAETGE